MEPSDWFLLFDCVLHPLDRREKWQSDESRSAFDALHLAWQPHRCASIVGRGVEVRRGPRRGPSLVLLERALLARDCVLTGL